MNLITHYIDESGQRSNKQQESSLCFFMATQQMVSIVSVVQDELIDIVIRKMQCNAKDELSDWQKS